MTVSAVLTGGGVLRLHRIYKYTGECIQRSITNVLLKTLRNEPAVLCLTETWLSEKYPNNIFKIDGYQTLVSVNRKRRGGVAIYVKDTLNYKIISSFNENKLQIITIKVEIGTNNEFYVSCVYLPPNATTDANLKNLENYLDKILLPPNAFNLVCGDFNINF